MEVSKNLRKYGIAVDGSQYSDYAFDLILNELYRKGDKVFVVHVTNPGKYSELPFAYKPDTIMSKYETKLTGKLLPDYYDLKKFERLQDSQHALELVNRIAVQFMVTVLIIGFHGHKMNQQKKELTKGISYLINYVKLPTIVVKERVSRKNKPNGVFTWLASIEDSVSRSFKAFGFSTDYMDISKDKIIGVHIKTYENRWAEEVKKNFENFCVEKGIVNYEFRIVEKVVQKSIGEHISDLVNFNEKEYIDFLVVGHKNHACDASISGCPLVEVMKKAKANILFYK